MNPKKLPNIIFFTWHDAGDWFGCYGHETVNTPNVDRLAAEGVRFANNFSACAICSPSRAAMMTGRFCQENGVMGLTHNAWSNRIHPTVPHLSPRLKALGYHTALFGVQHECAHEHVNAIIQPYEKIATHPWPHGDLLQSYIRKWIHQQKGNSKPFFAQIGTFEAHLGRFFQDTPPQPNEHYPPVQHTSKGLAEPAYLGGSEADQACVATLQGLLHRGDRVMGAILDSLDQAGLAENTLIVMNVDHGVGLDRAKGTCYDPGTRTAWILRWPGSLPENHCVDALTTHVDVLPTVWEILGLSPMKDADGRSLAPHIRGELFEHDDNTEETTIYSHMMESTRALRTQRYKFIRNFVPSVYSLNPRGDCASKHRGFDDPVYDSGEPIFTELYDLGSDPNETKNLARDVEHKEVHDRLDTRLWDFLSTHHDFILDYSVTDEFGTETYNQYQAYCRNQNQIPLPPVGPAADKIDAATSRGKAI
ncbi:MAG: sulfatase-like hydrolase/transferase [Verrucomicrobiota bacterium]